MPLLRLMLHRAPKLTARTFYAPILRFMRYRAPKLTARTFYAPLLRIMEDRVTNRKKCAETKVYC